ncbi:MAG TPA: deoxyribonuclease II family protein [Allosphingosinicella sp.]|nr:deoxyribonuclease II family protein [Allosphingosinicella sp.]
MRKWSLFASFAAAFTLAAAAPAQPATAPPPVPLVSQGHPADWIFVFKLNAGVFPTAANDPARTCPFGGSPMRYRQAFSQQYAYASSANPTLQTGQGLVGTGPGDPVGATFAQIYNGDYSYVVWNDQFQGHPMADRPSPWGHSKGMLAWNQNGDGLIVQVSTPAWPGAGSARAPRQGDGNTLGCTAGNNVMFSQHFFALRLTPQDVAQVLTGLANASVATDVTIPQLASIGGPQNIQTAARMLGRLSSSTAVFDTTLSSGVRLISKPSALHVPPWQMVSAVLGAPAAASGPPLRTANWWATPAIASTSSAGDPGCWGIPQHPGLVAIATSGVWNGRTIGLWGGHAPNGNHAKIGISLGGAPHYTIFGDLNQQGSLSPAARPCTSSQNGRGGLFFVVDNQQLHDSVAALIAGATAPSE